ncbi:glutamate receptor ionotropic, delta-1-like isoform X2 [Homarus americanus]|nr:glutamate receptor ionotropic, delta-1-like isoform X2 [Homarus americanus]
MVRLLEEVMEDPEVLRDVRDNPTTFRFKEGALMTVTTVHRPPHVTLINHQDGTYSITGPLAQLMDTVATSLNFTYRVVTPPDGTFGTATPNSSWSGMIGQVTRKEAMIALAPYATTWERYQAVDYLHHITHDYASMLNGKGRPEINPWGFVFPLQPLVWAALLAALVVAWLAIVLMGTKPVGSGHLTRSTHLLFQYLRVLLQQNARLDMVGGRERVLVGGWLVVAMMVMWSYSGNLVSLLAVRHIPQPIQKMRDVADDSSQNIIIEPKTIMTHTFSIVKTGDVGSLAALGDVGRIKYVVSSELQCAAETMVSDGHHALITCKLCLIKIISDLFYKTGSRHWWSLGCTNTGWTITFLSTGRVAAPPPPSPSRSL